VLRESQTDTVTVRVTWVSAIAITAGFMLADAFPGRLSTLYAEALGPLFAGAWLAGLFRRWWRRNEERILALPSASLYALLLVAAFLLLGGGVRLLWLDPWLFAPMLWPLAEIALTLRRRARRPTTAS